jgi:hypothetical protein
VAQPPPPATLTLDDGRLATPLVEDTGRSLIVADSRILADVSNDADSDGDEARVLVISRHADLVWLGGAFGVLAYRVR